MSGPMHTPGPWQMVEATERHGFYVTSDFGNTICDLYTMSKPMFASTANGGESKPLPFMHEMDGPNARLIAAAPELYEALQAFLAKFDPAALVEGDLSDSRYADAARLAYAALAKAEGRS